LNHTNVYMHASRRGWLPLSCCCCNRKQLFTVLFFGVYIKSVHPNVSQCDSLSQGIPATEWSCHPHTPSFPKSRPSPIHHFQTETHCGTCIIPKTQTRWYCHHSKTLTL
jgi:hypothetical protein